MGGHHGMPETASRRFPDPKQWARPLVIADAWPEQQFPARLIHALSASGSQLSVAAPAWAPWSLVDDDVRRIELPASNLSGRRLDRLRPSSRQVRPLAITHVRGLSARIGLRPQRERLKDWYRLVPFAGGRWDALFVPAEETALPYLPLFDLIAPAVVLVDRPLSSDRAPHLLPLLSGAREVRCASAGLADQAMLMGARRERITVVPPTVNASFFDEPPAREGSTTRLRLVCTTPFHWTAGHDDLLQALRFLQDDGRTCTLDIVADGVDEERLHYTLDDLAIADLVTVHHHVGRRELRGLLHRGDLYVLAATEDRPWAELMEAMACGLPVVATDLPAIRAMVPPEAASALVRPWSAVSLASVCSRLATDPAARQLMGQAARRRVLALMAQR